MESTYGKPETPPGWFDLTRQQQGNYISDFCNWGAIIFADERSAHKGHDRHIRLHERLAVEAERELRQRQAEPPI